MRNELHRTRHTAQYGIPPSYEQVINHKARRQTPAVLPMLDWPSDLFSRFIADDDDDTDYAAA